MTNKYELTLLRDGSREAVAAARPLRKLRSMPVTASSEWRADADLRRSSDELTAAHPQLDWLEVLSGDTPAIALIDRRFPILICLYETSAFLAIDTALTASSSRRVFRQAQAYLSLLDGYGYSTLVDHVTGAVDRVADAIPVLPGRFHQVGGRGWMARVGADSRIWFAAGWAGVGLAAAMTDIAQGHRHPAWMLAVVGLPAGAVLAGFQYLYDLNLLHERLREIRDVVAGPSDTETIRFSAPGFWLNLILTVGVLGGFATMGWFLDKRAIGAFIGATGFASVIYLVLSHLGHVELNARGVEGLGRKGRLFIPFGEVDRIERTTGPEVCTVWSAAVGTLWIPRTVSGRLQLLEVLSDRVEAACVRPAGAVPFTNEEIVRRLEREVAAARLARTLTDRRSRPLWLTLLRRHPLRAQYSWRRHLLARGQVTIAYVVGAPPALSTARPDRIDSSHPVLVVFAKDRAWRDGPALGAALLALMRSEEADEDVAPAILRFKEAVRGNAGFPLLVRVPPPLNGGTVAYCTSLIVSRRDLPLGYLRSWWLPVLIDPEACAFSAVIPPSAWGSAVRRQWKCRYDFIDV